MPNDRYPDQVKSPDDLPLWNECCKNCNIGMSNSVFVFVMVGYLNGGWQGPNSNVICILSVHFNLHSETPGGDNRSRKRKIERARKK